MSKYAKELRHNQTDAERIMWYHLRNKRFLNLKFRRQVDIGIYIVDFVCFEKKLILEIDGGQHFESENIEYDKNRTEYLKQKGFKVIRFTNYQVFNELDIVMNVIYNYCFL